MVTMREYLVINEEWMTVREEEFRPAALLAEISMNLASRGDKV